MQCISNLHCPRNAVIVYTFLNIPLKQKDEAPRKLNLRTACMVQAEFQKKPVRICASEQDPGPAARRLKAN